MAKPALSDVPEMPSAERKRLNCSRAHDHSSPWPMARCQKKAYNPLSPRNPGSRPKPPEPSDTCPSHWRECRRLWKRRPSPPAACPRGRFPRLHRARSTDKQQGQKKNFFFSPVLFFGSVHLWSILKAHLHRQAPTNTFRSPRSGFLHPASRPLGVNSSSIRRPGKINLQPSAASNNRGHIHSGMDGREGRGGAQRHA